jgi:hypothetical protein
MLIVLLLSLFAGPLSIVPKNAGFYKPFYQTRVANGARLLASLGVDLVMDFQS